MSRQDVATQLIKLGQQKEKYQYQAKGILEDEPLKFLLNIAEQVHIGDRDALETLILSRTSSHPDLKIKLNIALTGEPDEGKTHAGDTILDIAPPIYKYPTTKVAPKVLYYEALNGYSFYNKTIFLDDITDNDKEILKRIANTSYKPPSFSTLLKQVPHQIIFDYTPVVWTSRVDLIDDLQTRRRFYHIEIESSPDVLEHIFETEANNFNPQQTEDWLIAQVLMGIIMDAPLKVTIPHFDYSFVKTKTDLEFLLAMIKSIAKINAMKNVVENNTVVRASEEDVKEGVRLFRNNLVHQQKISKNALKILHHVPDNPPTENELNHPDKSLHTVEAIYSQVKNDDIGIDVVRKELKKMYDQGMVNAITRRYNRQFYFKVR